jgi:two-component system NtrC family sensor kinase
MDALGPPEKILVLSVQPGPEGRVIVRVQDNGIGITAENLPRIFEHGFTTKDEGHGFGLHSGMLAAREMGCQLTAHSDGIGKGAMFCLEIPPAQELIEQSVYATTS